LIAALENEFSKLPIKGKINKLRTKSREETANLSTAPTGFFSLQLPTGLGKTLTSIYWALLHAKKNELNRIIVVLPYINIIDQTASILKNIFGEENIIEHHSSVIDEDTNYQDELPDNNIESYKRLACENWDAPIIVTTSVQFFESLFSNKSFKCRKNHNIFNSVVIFDEVQTLPKHLAEPTIVMLKNISSFNKTSFLFCTATLPAFSKRNEFDGIENITPLISNPKIYFDETRRVEYKLLNELNPIALETVAKNILQEKDSYLVIVNTKSVAKELFQKVSSVENDKLYFHLSTAMCPNHRKKTISDIIKNLSQQRKIGVISTQLVEAGVDFDFPTVYRAIAPLDAVIQAAGRCNRNDRLKGKKGNVILFKLENQKMPDRTYSACADITEVSITDDINTLYEIDSYERYYKTVVSLLVDVDKYKINDERKEFNFKTVNQQYKIIDEATTPLFIEKYSDESKKLLINIADEIKYKGFITRESHRKLQQYSVQVYPNFFKKYNSQIEKFGDTFLIWHGGYDFTFGLSPEEIETVF
ncbi:MAG: CRISPR-associated helicase Cas3', partial [Ignavibacterium sp.]